MQKARETEPGGHFTLKLLHSYTQSSRPSTPSVSRIQQYFVGLRSIAQGLATNGILWPRPCRQRLEDRRPSAPGRERPVNPRVGQSRRRYGDRVIDLGGARQDFGVCCRSFSNISKILAALPSKTGMIPTPDRGAATALSVQHRLSSKARLGPALNFYQELILLLGEGPK